MDSKLVLLTESELSDLIRRTALAVAEDLREDLRRAQTLEIMSKAEVAEYLRCSPATVNRYMKDGMPYERLQANGHPTFRRREIDQWIGRRTHGSIQKVPRQKDNSERQELG